MELPRIAISPSTAPLLSFALWLSLMQHGEDILHMKHSIWLVSTSCNVANKGSTRLKSFTQNFCHSQFPICAGSCYSRKTKNVSLRHLVCSPRISTRTQQSSWPRQSILARQSLSSLHRNFTLSLSRLLQFLVLRKSGSYGAPTAGWVSLMRRILYHFVVLSR